MASLNQNPLNVLDGTLAPEGVVTSMLGTLYIQYTSGTTAVSWQKTSQAVAGVADNVGWTLVGAGTPPASGLSAWYPPAVPSADDEEFSTGSVLPAAYGITEGSGILGGINPYAAITVDSRYDVNTRRPSWLLAQPIATGDFYISRTYVQTTDYCWWARLSYNHRAAVNAVNNDYTCGLRLAQNVYSANDGIMIAINESDVNVIQAEFLKKVGGVVTSIGTTLNLGPNTHTPFEGVLIQRIGATNTYHGWVITNGGSLVYLGSTIEAGLTCTRVGVWFSNASTATPGNMIMGCDFIRRVNGALFLP